MLENRQNKGLSDARRCLVVPEICQKWYWSLCYLSLLFFKRSLSPTLSMFCQMLSKQIKRRFLDPFVGSEQFQRLSILFLRDVGLFSAVACHSLLSVADSLVASWFARRPMQSRFAYPGQGAHRNGNEARSNQVAPMHRHRKLVLL